MTERHDVVTNDGDGITRRRFLRGVAVTAVGTTAAGAVLDACAPSASAPPPYLGAPSAAPIPTEVPTILDASEVATLEGFVGHLLPPTVSVPGGIDTGVIDYIQRRLARGEGIPTYVDPPFVRTYHGPTPPGPDTDEVIWVHASELYRYGIQNVELPAQEQYHRGLAALEAWSQKKVGTPFAQASGGQRGAMLEDLASGKAGTFSEELTAKAFFSLVYNDAMQGWLADPTYGANRDLAVWSAIRYPGAQRMYMPAEVATGHTLREPQSLEQLPPMHPGEPEPHVVLPISGTQASDVGGTLGERGFVCDVPVQR